MQDKAQCPGVWPPQTETWTGDTSSDSDKPDADSDEEECFSDAGAGAATAEGGYVAPKPAQSDSDYDTQDDDEEDDGSDAFSLSEDGPDEEDDDEDTGSESGSGSASGDEAVLQRGSGRRRGGGRAGCRGRGRGAGTAKRGGQDGPGAAKGKAGTRTRRSANVPVRALLAVLARMQPSQSQGPRPSAKQAQAAPDRAEPPGRAALVELVSPLVGRSAEEANPEEIVSRLGKRSREGNRVVGLPDPGDSALVWVTEALETGEDLVALAERTSDDPCGWGLPVFALGAAQEAALCSAHDAPRTTVKSRRACRRCGKHNVQVRTLQLRRCDEPAVDDCVCLDCNAHWRG